MAKIINKYVLAVLMGGFCWGFMGFFTRNLNALGINSEGAIFVRCSVASVCFGVLIVFRRPKDFLIKPKDIWCFLGSGLLSLLFFTFCYFNAINMMNLSAAAILLYIAPTIVMLLSAILFKEKITRRKLFAVILAFAGCAFVSGILGGIRLSLIGFLFGIGSGIGYALYTIFSRFALEKGYSSVTINFYSCLLAAIGAFIILRPYSSIKLMFQSGESFSWCIATGMLSCFIPYLLYTYGLTGLENGKASVLASIEPVVASIVGIIIFHEKISVPLFVGIALVLSAVVLLCYEKEN